MADLDDATLEAVRLAIEALPADGRFRADHPDSGAEINAHREWGYATALDNITDLLLSLRSTPPPRQYLVTVKMGRNPDHNPRAKVTDVCPTSSVCTDSTGEHHTLLVTGEAELETTRLLYDHITRVEEVYA